jgi:hypothetical protein
MAQRVLKLEVELDIQGPGREVRRPDYIKESGRRYRVLSQSVLPFSTICIVTVSLDAASPPPNFWTNLRMENKSQGFRRELKKDKRIH